MTKNTKEEIQSYLTRDTLCFYDDHPCPTNFEGIEYPSVRHAIASLRTKNFEQRKKIASIDNAADLKEFVDKQCPSPPQWDKELVLLKLFTLTLLKFKNNPTFRQKLERATFEEILQFRDPRISSYAIIDDDVLAETLIRVKKALHK